MLLLCLLFTVLVFIALTGPHTCAAADDALNVHQLAYRTVTQEMFQSDNIQRHIPSDGLKVYFIQMSNGEATLLELNNGEKILIDTGSDFSEQELLDFLQQQDISTIDRIMVTSMQEEHIGNFKKLVEMFGPRHIYFPFYMEQYFQQMPLDEKITLYPLKKDDVFKINDELIFQVMHPDGSLSLCPQDNSMVFRLIHGEQRFLFTSDITTVIEQGLVDDYDLHSQILKVGDFGSDQSSGERFLEEVDAHVAIIFPRTYSYLDSEVLERLHETWMDVYPVKEHGHILIVSQGDDYELFVLSDE